MKKCVYFVVLFCFIFLLKPLFCFSSMGNSEKYANEMLANDINRLFQEKIPEDQLKEVLGFIIVSLKKPDKISDIENLAIERNAKFEVTNILRISAGGKKFFIRKDIYKVKKGDTLWTIAGKPEVYNDPTKWPFLYNANRDIVKNPDRIDVGVILKIPLSNYDYYKEYKGLINKISKPCKKFFVEEFNKVYDEFKDSIIKIICDDLKWCDIELPIDYIKYFIMLKQVTSRSPNIPVNIGYLVCLFLLEKGPMFLDGACDCRRLK